MDYQAFALKYRPKDFDDVIGQEHVVSSLKSAILKKRIHHAYLFSGPRGVGKTSLARIFAKAINCVQGPTVKPCGVCPSCVEIAKNISLDVIEIDGASNRGIDQVRTLIENIKLSPASSPFKIYIIDEVHMLTAEAFNALLKTLEEPPSHVKFVFATTHPHKVIPTILSRCQKFAFNLVSNEKIVNKLEKIVAAENIKVDSGIFYAIARAASGSIRDAESLLDQLVPVILGNNKIEDVFSFLGIIDEEILNNALKYIVAKDLDSLLVFVDKIIKQGRDSGIFLNALIEHLRNLLLAKLNVDKFRELIDLSPNSRELVCGFSRDISFTDIMRIIDLLIEAKEISSKLNTVRIPLEIALVKFMRDNSRKETAKNHKVSSGSATSAGKEVILPRQNAGGKSEDDSLSFIDNINADIMPDGDNLEGVFKDSGDNNPDIDLATEDNLLLIEVKAKWKEIIGHIQKTRAAIASHLSFAQPLSSSGNIVNIAFCKKDYFHKEILGENKNLKFIEEVISNILAKEVVIKFFLTDEDISSSSDKIAFGGGDNVIQEAKAAGSEEGGSEFINELLDSFGGKLHTDDE